MFDYCVSGVELVLGLLSCGDCLGMFLGRGLCHITLLQLAVFCVGLLLLTEEHYGLLLQFLYL